MYFYSFPLNFPQDVGFFSCQFCDLAGSHQARDQLVSTEQRSSIDCILPVPWEEQLCFRVKAAQTWKIVIQWEC